MSVGSEKRKSRIKTVAIVVLAVLLVLTFFSNTILNASLPEVSAQYPSYDSISTAVKLSGVVKANATQNVVYSVSEEEAEDGLTQSRKVISVFVREGDTVEKGAVLMELQGGGSEQLLSLRKQYEDLKQTYERALRNDAIDSMQDENELTLASRNLEKAKEELRLLREALSSGGSESRAALIALGESLAAELDRINEETDRISSSLAEAKQKLASARETLAPADGSAPIPYSASALAEAENRVSALESAYARTEAQKKTAESEYSRLSTLLAGYTEANALTNTIRSMRERIDSALLAFARSVEDEYAAEGKTPDSPITADEEAVEKAIGKLESTSTQFLRMVEDTRASLGSMKNELSEASAKLAVLGLSEINDVALYAYTKQAEDARAKCDGLSETAESLSAQLKEARAVLESVRAYADASDSIGTYESEITRLEAELLSLRMQKKQIESDVLSNEKALSSLSDPDTLKEKIKDAEESVSDLTYTYNLLVATQKRDAADLAIERGEQKTELDKLSAKIASYESAPENTLVTAPISGRVASVFRIPGETVTSGDTVAAIEIADKGYTCEITVSSDEARKISTSSPVSVTNYWWGGNLTAEIASIRSDPSSQGKNRIVTVRLNGDVYEGQSLNFTIGDKSSYYETVLPNSAVREDSEGKYVLIVETKESPLGTKYIARRVAVEVLASDEMRSAVSGSVGWQFVVTNASVPISDGQQVRLADT